MSLIQKLPMQATGSSLRLAASIIVLAPHDNELKILFIKRSSKSKFMPNTYVFPGGVLDKSDCSPQWPKLYPQLALQKHMGEQLPYRVCALRELFEETGLLLASEDKESSTSTLDSASLHTCAVTQLEDASRQQVDSDPSAFISETANAGYVPELAQIYPWARWITPMNEGGKRRYDTWFYLALLAQAPPSHVSPDDLEVTKATWMSAQMALRTSQEGSISLPPPTTYILEELRRHSTVQSLMNVVHEDRLVPWLPTLYLKTAESSTDDKDAKAGPHLICALPGDELWDSEACIPETKRVHELSLASVSSTTCSSLPLQLLQAQASSVAQHRVMGPAPMGPFTVTDTRVRRTLDSKL